MRHPPKDRPAAAKLDGGTFTLGEAQHNGISARTLYRMCLSDKVTSLSRGVYQMAGAPRPQDRSVHEPQCQCATDRLAVDFAFELCKIIQDGLPVRIFAENHRPHFLIVLH